MIGEARLARIPRAMRHILTLALVVIGWVLFAIEDFGALGAYLRAMFSPAGGLLSDQAAVWVLSYLPLLTVGALASTPAAATLVRRKGTAATARWGVVTGCLLILAASTAALVAQSYNPFLYFRF